MATDIATLDRGAAPALASRRATSATDAALSGGYDSFATVSIKGKVWSIRHQGEEEIVKNKDGSPMQALPVVIVGVAASNSKTWYSSGFTQESRNAPDCSSIDGVRPDPASPKKQSALCADCPRNVFQTRMTNDGRTTKGKECQDSRRLAVVPLGDLDNEVWGGPMLLRLPVMSINNLRDYARLLRHKGAKIDLVGTALKFDYSVTYPRVEFEAIRWLSDEEAEQVVGPDGTGGIAANPVIGRMLAQSAQMPAPQSNGNGLAGSPPAAARAAASSASVTDVPFDVEDQPAPRPAPAANGTRRAPAGPLAVSGRSSASTEAEAAAPSPPMATVVDADSDMLNAINDMLNP